MPPVLDQAKKRADSTAQGGMGEGEGFWTEGLTSRRVGEQVLEEVFGYGADVALHVVGQDKPGGHRSLVILPPPGAPLSERTSRCGHVRGAGREGSRVVATKS